MNTLTPKFDRLVAKARKAGHNVEVTEEKLKKGSYRNSAQIGICRCSLTCKRDRVRYC